METAARISSVGVSPQQAITTSGSASWSLPAHCQMLIPSVQCTIAASMVSHCGRACLPATTTFTIVPAAKTMIEDREEAVGIGREVDPHDICLLIDHVVQK